jgi:mannosyltransferase OCH1-like enzyme
MIPKKVHISAKNDKIFTSKSFLSQKGIQNLVKLNPEWEVEFSDDNEVELYLKENISSFDYDLIKEKTIVEKLDLWRLIKMYLEGGIYIDIDRFYNIPLSEIITDNIKCVLPTYLDSDFSHDIMICAPNNPMFLDAANLNIQRRRMGYGQIYLLGPQTYMHAVSKNLTGQIIESNPGKDVMDLLRKQIDNTGFAKTFRENPWKETLVFKATSEFDEVDFGLEKIILYKDLGMNYWAGPLYTDKGETF